jgi:hypothetical protein
MFICVSKSSTHINKENANNAHKYDCSSPRNKQQQQKKVKKKRERGKRDLIQQPQRESDIRLK